MTDLARYQDPLTIQRVLHGASTIAIVGLSRNELRASYFVGYYLKRHGYRVIPVNPRETEILGEKCYASLADIPEPADVVNVFRAPDALPGIARETVAIGAGTLWCQFGVINLEAAKIAEDGGVTVIMDRCIKVEHARYAGRMHWLGFNTQRITSVRAGLQLVAPVPARAAAARKRIPHGLGRAVGVTNPEISDLTCKQPQPHRHDRGDLFLAETLGPQAGLNLPRS
jgi:predicted CoA-binding protein